MDEALTLYNKSENIKYFIYAYIYALASLKLLTLRSSHIVGMHIGADI